MNLLSFAKSCCIVGVISFVVVFAYSFTGIPSGEFETLFRVIFVVAATVFLIATFLLWILDLFLLGQTWGSRDRLQNIALGLLIMFAFPGAYFGYVLLRPTTARGSKLASD